jgi:hypothetical protein
MLLNTFIHSTDISLKINNLFCVGTFCRVQDNIMKAKIALVTVSGKAYYLIVNELKRKNLPFLSLTPGEAVPIEMEVVITTQDEMQLVNHKRLLVYEDGMIVESLVNEASKIAAGKEYFDKITVGIDPGDVVGIAVLADGKVIETANCFSVKETLDEIVGVLKGLENVRLAYVSVKVGDGVPSHKENLLRILDKALPSNVVLESVSEAGTNRCLSEAKHRRGLRDIVSAIQIAGRSGQRFPRRKTSESNC